MSLWKVFDIAGASMSAQSVRLNTTASNLANANTVAGRPEDVYQARHPVFETVLIQAGHAGVAVREIHQEQAEPLARYQPGHPLADEQGYVYAPRVDVVEAMADMLSASRSYQSSLDMMSTTKDLLQRTLETGRG